MTSNQTKKSRSSDYGKLNALAQLVCYRLDSLLEKLEVQLRRTGKIYIGCCPIHCGDNYSALNLYPEGETVPGYWCCRTRHCERIFQKTIIGFTRGILSQKYFGWDVDDPQKNLAPFDKTIDWLCKFVEMDWNDIKIDERLVEINKFASQVETFKKISSQQSGVSRDSVREHLEIPASYYIKRGYRPETLNLFDVGLCKTPGKELSGRVVVPIYDESGKQAVAFTGRSVFEECKSCGYYHNPTTQCPAKGHNKGYEKWHHVGNTGSTLYNWWNAKDHIRDSARIILVEGPGDVWKLVEAGVKNVVAMFGADITDEQQIQLERSGAMKVTIIRDNDATGEISEKILREKLRYYKVNCIVPNAKDVGDMSIEEIQKDIVPNLI